MYTVDVQNGILYEQERLNIKYSFILESDYALLVSLILFIPF